MSTLTSANATFLLSIKDLFPTPVALEGYATDDAFTADAITQAEVQIGVDGQLSAGFVFAPQPMGVAFQATSRSLIIMDAWRIQQASNREVFAANGVITIPSIGMIYTLKNGYLTSAKPLPDAKRVLQPMAYTITWESIIGSPI